MTDPTPDEIARAKRWAAMQTPPVTVEFNDRINRWIMNNVPECILLIRYYDYQENAAWSALALALRPVFDSIGPVVREECARLAQQHFIPGHSVAGPHFAQQLADAIRAMK